MRTCLLVDHQHEDHDHRHHLRRWGCTPRRRWSRQRVLQGLQPVAPMMKNNVVDSQINLSFSSKLILPYLPVVPVPPSRDVRDARREGKKEVLDARRRQPAQLVRWLSRGVAAARRARRRSPPARASAWRRTCPPPCPRRVFQLGGLLGVLDDLRRHPAKASVFPSRRAKCVSEDVLQLDARRGADANAAARSALRQIRGGRRRLLATRYGPRRAGGDGAAPR